MNCSKHKEREAIGICVKCHKLICEECAVKIQNKYYCKECIIEMYSSKENEVNNDKPSYDLNNLNHNVNFKNDTYKSFIMYKGMGSILGIIAIVLLIPRIIIAFNEFGVCFENIYLSFKYDNGLRAFLFLINSILILAEPVILIVLASILFINFTKINKTVRIIAPIIIVLIFTLIIFITGNIAIRFIDFMPFIDLIYYIIPVTLIIIGNCLNND